VQAITILRMAGVTNASQCIRWRGNREKVLIVILLSLRRGAAGVKGPRNRGSGLIGNSRDRSSLCVAFRNLGKTPRRQECLALPKPGLKA